MYSKVSIIKIISSTQKVCSQEGVAAAHLNRYLNNICLRVLYTEITACAIGCEFDTLTMVHYYVEKMETSSYCVLLLLNEEYNAKIDYAVFIVFIVLYFTLKGIYYNNRIISVVRSFLV